MTPYRTPAQLVLEPRRPFRKKLLCRLGVALLVLTRGRLRTLRCPAFNCQDRVGKSCDCGPETPPCPGFRTRLSWRRWYRREWKRLVRYEILLGGPPRPVRCPACSRRYSDPLDDLI